MKRIAVIGAGIAGATAARTLADAGLSVTVFEKARGPGGRMASRRVARDETSPAFDHGCQMLSEDADIAPAEPWTHRLATFAGTTLTDTSGRTRPVPVPRMNTPVSNLLDGIDTRYAVRIDRIEHTADRVSLAAEGNSLVDTLGEYDATIITTPAPQAIELLETAAPTIACRAQGVTYDPNWTLMLDRPADAPPLPFDAAHVAEHPIAWLCNDSAKPGRQADSAERWIAQFEAAFSRDTIDESPDDIAPRLLAAARELLGESVTLAQKPHRWRYAFVTKAVGEPCLVEGRVAVAGDWLLGPRAHHAARSGGAAALAIID
ncbi:MAG: FAD-dependent oxidoreductase [Planctomycetota bacterium]